ncbi:hypothetical protein LPW11_13035 [Geomonas sp. RF6]|uniref:lipopolysaccharide biosynthesis protein n=1 Tax=Geomonas sp. RF6 TaxID=2897342 RepID=UPI001E56770F|nr:hypothetical protein [Geomonas sp. RF6]UFS68823.1 hypothetical protein LPW11_13035 [Geomonas sp. RF6]
MRKWSLIEQGFLSIANFGMAVFLARELSKGEWGSFSLGFALMLFAQGFQRALVSIPVATMAHSAEILSASLPFWRRTQTKITAAATAGLGLAALAWRPFGTDSGMPLALLIAAILVPGFFSLEFWRRVLIQTREIKAAAMVSSFLLFSVALLIGTVALRHGGALFAACGMSACTLAAGALLRRRAMKVLPATAETISFAGELYRFGRWATLSHVAFSGYNTAIQMVLTMVCGSAAMGSFAAVRNLTQPINTLIGAVDNLDKPRAARAFAGGSFPDLFSSLWRTMATLTMLGGGYLILCAAGGGHLVNALYHGRYGYAWNEIWLWCLIASAMMAAQPMESGLYVAQRTDALFVNRVISAVIGLGTAVITIPRFGVVGALMGLATGWIATAFLAFLQLQLFARKAGATQPATALEAVQG